MIKNYSKGLFLITIILLNFLTISVVNGQVIDEGFLPIIKGAPRVFAIEMQPDDKVLLAGEISVVGTTPVNRLIRLNAEGTLDNTFNTEDFGSIYAIYFEPTEEKIYIGGQFEGYNDLVRLNLDGSIDRSFELGIELSYVSNIDQQSDGQLIIMSFTPSNQNLIRIDKNGHLDQDFTFNQIYFGGSVANNDLEVLANDKIVIAVDYIKINDVEYNQIVQLNADGTLDNDFDIGTGPYSADYFYSRNISEFEDGDLLISGRFSEFNGNVASGVVKLNPDGSLDDTFVLPGTTGSVFGDEVVAKLDNNNKILIGGIIYGSGVQYKTIRLNSDGTSDGTYVTGIYDISNHVDEIYLPVFGFNSSDEIYIGGSQATLNNVTQYGLSKVDNDGNVIGTFDASLGGQAKINAIEFLDNGKALIGGNFIGIGNEYANYLAMLNDDGTLDSDFQMNLGEGPNREVFSIAQNGDGDFIVGGAFNKFESTTTGALIKIGSDGTRDATFDPDVYVGYVGPGIEAIEFDSEGKILIGGNFSYVNGTNIYGLARLNVDGTIDGSFNSTNALDAKAYIKDIEIREDDKIIAGGHYYLSSSSPGGILVRFNADGTFDDTFSNDYDLSELYIQAVELKSDNSIVIGGYSQTNAANLVILDEDGILINDQSISVGQSWESINSIILLDDNNALLGGEFNNINSVQVDDLVKVSLDGALDSEVNYLFNDNGNYYSSLNSIKLLADNRLLASGYFRGVDNESAYGLVILNLDAPSAPFDLNSTFDFQNAVSLSWTDNSSKNDQGFELYKSTDNINYTLLASLTDDESFYDDIDVSLSTTYYYKVRSVSTLYYSGFSEVAILTTEDLNSPDGLNATFDFINGVNLTWNDNSSDEEDVLVYKSVDNLNYDLLETLDVDAVSYVDAAVELGTSYYYKTSIKVGLFESEYSDVLEFTTPVTASLNAPSNLSLTFINGAINLDWVDSDTELAGFEVYKLQEDEVDYELISTQSELSYTDSDVDFGNSYFYKVRAYNSFEFSEFSTEQGYTIASTTNLNANSLEIYPNPTTGELFILNGQEKIEWVKVINSGGQVVFVLDSAISTDNGINLSNLSRGLYSVMIKSNQNISTHRIVVK